MRIRVVAVLAFAAILASACHKNAPVASIAADSIEISGEAGSNSVSFSIENYTSGTEVQAESDRAWLTIDKVSQSSTGTVDFSVTANRESSSREAELTISYGSVSRTVTVTQLPYSDEFIPFEIEVSALTPYSCTVTYTPVSYRGNYVFMVMGASSFESYLNGNDLDGLIDSDLEWLEYQAEYNSLSLGDFLSRAAQLYAFDGAVTTMPYTSLSRDTDYYAYCYGLSLDGEPQTGVSYMKFRTEITQTSDMTFSGQASNIGKTSASIVVTPSSDTETYFWTYVSEMDLNNYDLETIMDNMILNIQASAQEMGVSLESLLCKGRDNANLTDLWPGTQYSIVAWGMDGAGTPTTQPQVAFSFSTEAEAISDDCTFTIDCPEVRSMDILVHVTPSNPETRYYIAVVREDLCTGYDDDQMAQRIINMEADRLASGYYGDITDWADFQYLYTGEQSLWANADLYWTFAPETMYHIYVFGINNYGQRSTDVARMDVQTKSMEESEMTFTAELVSSAWNLGTFHITPSKSDEYWLPFLINTDFLEYYRKEDGSLDEASLVEYIEHYYDNSASYYVIQGETDSYRTSWISDTDYTLLLCGWAGSNTTPFYEFRFHSPEIPFGQSDAEMTASYELFDGDALYEMDPVRWDGYQGSCVMYIKFNPNEHAVHWYGGVWGTVDAYETGIHHLMTLIRNEYASFVDTRTGIISPWFGYTWSFSYVAEGADGTFGQWHYEEFTPIKEENMTEPYDFWSNSSANSMILSVPRDKGIDQMKVGPIVK